MRKERLEEVVKNVVFNECGLTGTPMSVELPEDDYWYLYEQAERVQELEQQNKRYRETLEFYANRDNYKLEHFDPNIDDYMSTVDYDEGQTARKALKGEN